MWAIPFPGSYTCLIQSFPVCSAAYAEREPGVSLQCLPSRMEILSAASRYLSNSRLAQGWGLESHSTTAHRGESAAFQVRGSFLVPLILSPLWAKISEKSHKGELWPPGKEPCPQQQYPAPSIGFVFFALILQLLFEVTFTPVSLGCVVLQIPNICTYCLLSHNVWHFIKN